MEGRKTRAHRRNACAPQPPFFQHPHQGLPRQRASPLV